MSYDYCIISKSVIMRKQLKLETILSNKINRDEYVSRLKHKCSLYFDCIENGISQAIAIQFAGFNSIKEFERAQIHFDLEEYQYEC